MLHAIWIERNNIRYRGKRGQIPMRTLLGQLNIYAQALIDVWNNNKKKRIWERELEVLKRASNLLVYNNTVNGGPTT